MLKNVKIGIGMFNQWIEEMPLSQFTDLLKKNHADFAEFKISVINWNKRKDQVRQTIESGLDVTVHAPFEGKYNPFYFEHGSDNETKKLYYELLFILDEISRMKGSSVNVNVHAASVSKDKAGVEELMDRSRIFFDWINEHIKKNLLNLNITCELLPQDKVKNKTGISQLELIELSEKLKEDIDFCLDMGHYYSNLISYSEKEFTSEFLDRVSNIHIHDIINGSDHVPLIFDTIPYKKYFSDFIWKKLKTIAIELNFENTKLYGEPYQLLYKSLNKLREIINIH